MMIARHTFVLCALLVALLLHPQDGRSETLTDRFFASQNWTSLQGSVTWTQSGQAGAGRQESLFMNARGDLAFWAWPADMSPSAQPASMSLFKGRYYSSYLQGEVTGDSLPLTAKSVRAALLRLITRGAALRPKAQVLSTSGQTVALRWKDWGSSPVIELSLDGTGRLVSAKDLSSTVMLSGVQYGIQGGKTFIERFEIATDHAVLQGLSFTGQVKVQAAALKDVVLDGEQESRWFRLP